MEPNQTLFRRRKKSTNEKSRYCTLSVQTFEELSGIKHLLAEFTLFTYFVRAGSKYVRMILNSSNLFCFNAQFMTGKSRILTTEQVIKYMITRKENSPTTIPSLQECMFNDCKVCKRLGRCIKLLAILRLKYCLKIGGIARNTAVL